MGAARPDSPPTLIEKENPGTEITLTTKRLWKVCLFSSQSSH